MKIFFNDGKEFDVLSIDNSAAFGEDKVSIRLTISLADTSYSLEDIINLNLDYSKITLVEEDATIVFEDYKLEAIRKSYGVDRLNLEFTKK